MSVRSLRGRALTLGRRARPAACAPVSQVVGCIEYPPVAGIRCIIPAVSGDSMSRGAGQGPAPPGQPERSPGRPAGEQGRRYAGFCPGLAPRDGHLSRSYVAAALQRSTRKLSEQPWRFLSDLAPGEVYRAGYVTAAAGGLLHHRFTLTAGRSPRRSVLCGTVSRVSPGGCYPPPCSVEPGRSSAPRPARSASAVTRPSAGPFTRPSVVHAAGRWGRTRARASVTPGRWSSWSTASPHRGCRRCCAARRARWGC